MCVHTGDVFGCHCDYKYVGTSVRLPNPKHYPDTYKVEAWNPRAESWYPLTVDLTLADAKEIYGDRLITEPDRYRLVKITHHVEIVGIEGSADGVEAIGI